MLPYVVAADQSETRRLGLQILIAADARGSRNVATRTIAASRRAVGLDPEPFAEGQEDVEEGGCWVMYGWRRRLRRLPPLTPLLRRVGNSPWALKRTHTSDGRVVITREPAPLRGRVVARRLDGRLILDLVDSSPVAPPPRQRPPPPHPSITDAADDDDDEQEKEDVSADVTIAPGLDVPATVLAAPILACSSLVASPVPAVACFEAVIRTSPPLKVPFSVPRMVH